MSVCQNLGHNFSVYGDRAFILHMCIPCNKISLFGGGGGLKFVTLTWGGGDLVLKNLVIAFEWLVMELPFYHVTVFLLTRPLGSKFLDLKL